ncbi:sce7725 family protein [Microbacterium sp. NPDC058389]|uniref:sce7725 family protein n=1 Tax=Microbacterium sp. NPDC058389 TaxID=3346475 RepID=UPI003661089F
MYVPFLYGRANELLALRDLTDVALAQPVSPAIEALKSDPASLVRAIDAMSTAGIVSSVVMNPSARELSTSRTLAAWSAAVRGAAGFASVRPAISLESTTSLGDVEAFVTEYAQRPITFVARSGVIPAVQLAAAAAKADVLVLVHHNLAASDYDAAFGVDRVIPLTNSFTPQPRNVDYSEDDWFSTAATSYGGSGRPGFGDYTVLDPAVRDTRGGAPGAVVIHATYIDGGGALWVRHFLSDSVIQGEISVGEKLLQAMGKLQSDRAMFLTSPGMSSYDVQYATRRETALGTNKRQQISHHIYTTLAAIR